MAEIPLAEQPNPQLPFVTIISSLLSPSISTKTGYAALQFQSSVPEYGSPPDEIMNSKLK